MLKESYLKGRIEAGCDEAGRGCLAGPVVAAAVILNPGFNHHLLNDSKKLTVNQRDEARQIILQNAVSYSISMVDAEEIDRVNILKASIYAMHRALQELDPQPEFILVDGNRFIKYSGVDHLCVVKGDGKYTSIAAASILAKTERDRYMCELHQQFPDYRWDRNKGYPTKIHREAIERMGITQYHRKTFRLQGKQMNIEFS